MPFGKYFLPENIVGYGIVSMKSPHVIAFDSYRPVDLSSESTDKYDNSMKELRKRPLSTVYALRIGKSIILLIDIVKLSNCLTVFYLLRGQLFTPVYL